MTPLPASPFMEIQNSCGQLGEAGRAGVVADTRARLVSPAGLAPGPQDSIADHIGLAAVEAELFNLNLTADPEPLPGPSEIEELQALLTSIPPLHKAA